MKSLPEKFIVKMALIGKCFSQEIKNFQDAKICTTIPKFWIEYVPVIVHTHYGIGNPYGFFLSKYPFNPKPLPKPPPNIIIILRSS
jgi:hypothetical protein